MSVTQEAAKALGDQLGQGIAQVFSDMVTGAKFSSKQFLGVVLGMIGQMMVSWGTAFLLYGLAAAFVPALQGNAAGAIAGGLALIAAGGALAGAGAKLQESAQGQGGGAGAGTTGTQAGQVPIGTTGAQFAGEDGTAIGTTTINLNVETLLPSAVPWDELAENHIGPAMEGMLKRGASRMNITVSD